MRNSNILIIMHEGTRKPDRGREATHVQNLPILEEESPIGGNISRKKKSKIKNSRK